MEGGIDYIIRPICEFDRVNSFRSGDSAFLPLKTFLRNQALQFQQHMVAQTYVAVGPDNSKFPGRVLGFVTLTCSEIDIRNGYDIQDCPDVNRYDSMPAIKIARLAVDSRHRGSGIGGALIEWALAIALDEIGPAIGCRFLITDSKQLSVSFYQKNGFRLLDDEQLNDVNAHPVMFLDLYSAMESIPPTPTECSWAGEAN